MVFSQEYVCFHRILCVRLPRTAFAKELRKLMGEERYGHDYSRFVTTALFYEPTRQTRAEDGSLRPAGCQAQLREGDVPSLIGDEARSVAQSAQFSIAYPLITAHLHSCFLTFLVSSPVRWFSCIDTPGTYVP